MLRPGNHERDLGSARRLDVVQSRHLGVASETAPSRASDSQHGAGETAAARPKRKRADRESGRSRTARAFTFTRNSDRGLACPGSRSSSTWRFVRARNVVDQANHMLGLLADERDDDGVVASVRL